MPEAHRGSGNRRAYHPISKGKRTVKLLKETVADDIEQLRISKDQDAKIGHKSADSSFFGYKTHIAMSEERIITAATITTGEKTDGKELKALIEKSTAAGMVIETVIARYSLLREGKY
ncbi:hypothetical protein QFZ73_001549 [Peribacillus sp. V2I11]|nr:hypothetical protein [Peribacillus sp. V2I11]